ncbi:hypothetical protein EHQ12_05935 [Leptospira gomenensis]|uniref:Uncharacterized protein n=1 Tax=Leptospira gomenensis TaxID=2484974 RepID=A0A5F1Z0K7_9LEPT|nr:hypothetical protein [Leptospira gomenensis]TGK30983.1 hypothetical protein EHQ17_14790 [Leptospira gomenensis]TGK41729.1 hypothetical protein EHQ12_05935 [Leptospira gomenensis]TGK45297.1 hypothetical protein EHQ07_10210 [Leptospira gomenensis]TGK66211.1 hypothetical protein EHQ13_03945 [Leptospira gomenensis]
MKQRAGLYFSIVFLLLAGNSFPEELITFTRFRQIVPLEGVTTDSEFFVDARLPRFSVLVSVVGPVLETPEVERWPIVFQENPSQKSLKFEEYRFEVALKSRNEIQKVFLTEAQIPEIEKAAKAGKILHASIVYYGYTKNKKRVFLLSSASESKTKIDKSICFADSLMDLRLGADYAETIADAETKFGPSYQDMQIRDKKGKVFVIDRESKTVLYVYDGGEEERNKVQSLQLSTYGNSKQRAVKNVFFGDDAAFASKKLGIQFKVHKQTDETDIYYYDYSGCTFETKNNKVFSIFITEE